MDRLLRQLKLHELVSSDRRSDSITRLTTFCKELFTDMETCDALGDNEDIHYHKRGKFYLLWDRSERVMWCSESLMTELAYNIPINVPEHVILKMVLGKYLGKHDVTVRIMSTAGCKTLEQHIALRLA